MHIVVHNLYIVLPLPGFECGIGTRGGYTANTQIATLPSDTLPN